MQGGRRGGCQLVCQVTLLQGLHKKLRKPNETIKDISLNSVLKGTMFMQFWHLVRFLFSCPSDTKDTAKTTSFMTGQ